MSNSRPAGFWVLEIVGLLILLMLLVGQMMSFINYDFTVSIGMQESVDVIGAMGVAVNKGFGVADTIIYLPLLVAGLIGLWIRKGWGMHAMAGALGITAYWPMAALFLLLFARGAPGFYFTAFVPYAILLTAFTVYSIWGLWYLYARRAIFAK
jgi:hypothetical protein